MKSFFEFYNHLKNKKLNEQDQMGMQSAGGMAPAPRPNAPSGGMDMGMGNTPPAMNSPSTAGAGANQQGVLGQDMDLDMGASDTGDSSDITRQTDQSIGEQDPSQLMDNLKQLMNFVKNFGVGDDQDKSEKKDELNKQLQAVMENLGQLTGAEVPSDDSQADGEMGGEQPDSSEEDGGLPDASNTDMGAGGSAPLGGNTGSDAFGSGDMGGNMAGGASAQPAGGMGGMGGGGGFQL
jgi:hypothetical protein